MKRIVMVAALVCLAAVAPFGAAGPVNGALGTKHKLEAGERFGFTLEFKGGERACVIVKGDHDPPVNLRIAIYDVKEDPATNKLVRGDLVAKDDLGGDLCSVIWYPPRTARYIVEISSSGGVWNGLWIAIR